MKIFQLPIVIFTSLIILSACDNQEVEVSKPISKPLGSVVEVLVYGTPDPGIEVKDPAFSSPFVEPTFDRDEKELEVIGSGTGFVMEGKLIVTNAHILEGGNRFGIRLKDGSEYRMDLVNRDKVKDVALLRPKEELEKLDAFGLSESDEIMLEETIKMVGLNDSKTGVIIQKNQSVVAGSMNHPVKIEGLLETSIPIQSGDSGSPLVDINGQVMGLISIANNENLNVSFAIPIKIIREFLTELDGVK